MDAGFGFVFLVMHAPLHTIYERLLSVSDFKSTNRVCVCRGILRLQL